MPDADILVLGAGVAGLTAAIDLARSGLKVTIIEARDRIGGRIFTRHDVAGNPVELGAEFVHGCPPEIWDILRQHKIGTHEVQGQSWCAREAQLQPCDLFSQVDDLLAQMDDQGPDESFLDFLARHQHVDPETRDRALAYVTGFNAADPARVSVHWLVEELRAEENIQGHRAFRIAGGYATLMEVLRAQAAEAGVAIQLNTVAETIRWSPGTVQISAHKDGQPLNLTAARALITLPLAVLQANPGDPGAVRFAPDLPKAKREALQQLEMGKVVRITFRFRERFWDNIRPSGSRTLEDMGFLFTFAEEFPTWWTTMPEKLPIITAWAPFQAAERLSGQSPLLVLSSALETLSRALKIERKVLEKLLDSAYTHDWQTDPFSRGAYSYVKAGGMQAPGCLAALIENTLFFAGEATDLLGNTGTVHGAMATGHRAAQEILKVR